MTYLSNLALRLLLLVALMVYFVGYLTLVCWLYSHKTLKNINNKNYLILTHKWEMLQKIILIAITH